MLSYKDHLLFPFRNQNNKLLWVVMIPSRNCLIALDSSEENNINSFISGKLQNLNGSQGIPELESEVIQTSDFQTRATILFKRVNHLLN